MSSSGILSTTTTVALKPCVQELFKQQAAATPTRTALIDGSRHFSFADLDTLSDALATKLESLGGHQGSVIALIMDRSAVMIVAMLAVLKCGAAYMSLDKGYPVIRNRYCLDKANVHLVLTDCDCQELCSGSRLSYDFTIADLREESIAHVPVAVSSESPAYVMFTSGTTAGPKGVVIPHRAVTRLVLNTNYIDIGPDDAILQLSTPSFDASTFEIWGALLNGATLVLYSGSVLDPNLFKQHIIDHKITILWLTAALFHLFVDKYLDALRPLRILLAGGDVLHAKAVSRALDEIEGIIVINGYGPTENTTFTCCHVMTKANPPSGSVPIGRPVTGTQVLILDDQSQEVPRGKIGELYAAGSGVALGYLDDDPAASPFIYNETLAPGLLYRTGDLVRLNDEGIIDFVGRKDNQVKIRGYRVSLEEVRACLLESSGVSDAVVGCEESFTGDQILTAYVQGRTDLALSPGSLKKHLAERLASYMVPDKIVIRTTLPITKNGKIDNKVLFSSSA